ncbi:glucokinase [Nitrosococcus oceani]|uniref:glucokinase n=1 Tax=Nitrosococcus oceani TaxID=1229 RepID=UPI0004E92A47|nr:glucokinase [Nitrosococcus oceani]KFI22904.1 glucokinase [Nitrosococcus oceani]
MKVLAADIGGTKTLLQITEWGENTPQVLAEQRYLSGDYSSFNDLLRTFLTETGSTGNGLRGACFAVAGVVTQGVATATNLPWRLDATHLEATFELPQVVLINDFTAIGYGIEGLTPDDFAILQSGKPEVAAPQAVIGAGTGLGQALLVWQERTGHYQVLPTEGGHVDFAPQGKLQIALLTYLSRQLDHVSYERVLSGSGLVTLYHFLKKTSGMAESPALKKALSEGDQAAAISRSALEHGDPLAGQALDLLVQIYGAQAGNLALACLPRGGLFVAGGIAPKIIERLQAGGFMEAFLSKGRLSELMHQIPVKVILESKVGLLGASRLAMRLAYEQL